MALRIRDLPTKNLTKNDLFEIEGYEDRTSGKVSAQQIATLCATLNNGAFKGATDKGLDSFTYSDTGVYYWSGSAYKSGMPTNGILEVICSVAPDVTVSANETPSFIQRLTSGPYVFQRAFSGVFSDWSVLRNENGAKILTGVSSGGSVTFPTVNEQGGLFFTETPVVTVTPVNNDASNYVKIINIGTVSQSGFSVYRFKSAVQTAVDQTTEHQETTETSDTSNNTKTVVTNNTKTIMQTRGAWEVDDTMTYYWTAIQED